MNKDPNLEELKKTLSQLDSKILPSGKLYPDNIREKLTKRKKGSLLARSKIIAGIACAAAAVLLVIALVPSLKPTSRNRKDFKLKLNNYSKVYSLLENYKAENKNTRGEDWFLDGPELVEDEVGAPGNAPGDNSSGAPKGNTNLQVAGVDEADIIKNDGKRLYVLSGEQFNSNGYTGTGYVLTVFDCTSPSSPRVIAKIKYYNETEKFAPSEMFIREDKLIVLGNYIQETAYDQKTDPGRDSKAEIAQMPYYYSYKTGCIIYDIAKDGQLTELRRFSQDGNGAISRMIDGKLYIISTHYVYFDYIEKDKAETFIPKVTDTAANLKDAPVMAANIACMPAIETPTYLVISVLDTDNVTRAAHTQTILGASSSNVYCSLQNLYVTSTNFLATDIIKFSLKGFAPEFVAQGKVNGYVLNQYSMDEYKGNFRIATTSYADVEQKNDNGNDSTVSVGNTVNNVYVLDKNLKTIGKLEGLAPTERIYSARFDKDMGYLVTYRQMDPLFAIDLSNPTAPKVLGELKIPGFSEQLHSFDDKTLLGIGQDDDRRTKVSLFDVSNPQSPIELASETLAQLLFAKGMVSTSDIYVYSTAQSSYKDLLLYRDKNIIGMNAWVYDYTNVQGNYKAINCYVILGADKETGFTLRKVISTENASGYAILNRGTYIGNILYHITDGQLTWYDIDTLDLIGSLPY